MSDCKYDLICLDGDGTIIDPVTLNTLPKVEYILSAFPCKRAIVTNQGGPACREAGWGDKYPTVATIQTRYHLLGIWLDAKVYISWAYISKSHGLIMPASLGDYDPDTELFRCKPGPGMILEAMRDAGATPERTLMVGDRESDQIAAQNAGCDFVWAWEFFGWEKPHDAEVIGKGLSEIVI